tara:strand:+ start:623 stop:1567 length:945 start_codon:yes stop_codon:yes gene_type:complete
MEITRSPVLISIRSRDLSNLNSFGSTGTMSLFQSIECDSHEILTIQLLSCIIPNSWYNLSAKIGNNTVSFSETNDVDVKQITIPDGSYNIDELMNQVKTLLNSNSSNNCIYTLTYNEITNSVNITHNKTSSVETVFNFLSNNNARRFLGFSQGEFNINSSNTSINSDRAVDVTDTLNSVYLRTNLSNLKVIESSTNKYSNILAHIPIDLQRNDFIIYNPPQPFEMALSVNQISRIDLEFTFQNEELKVDFGRGDWECNLLVNYRRQPRAEKLHRSIHRDISDKLQKLLQKDSDNVDNENKINEIKELRKKYKVR